MIRVVIAELRKLRRPTLPDTLAWNNRNSWWIERALYLDYLLDD